MIIMAPEDAAAACHIETRQEVVQQKYYKGGHIFVESRRQSKQVRVCNSEYEDEKPAGSQPARAATKGDIEKAIDQHRRQEAAYARQLAAYKQCIMIDTEWSAATCSGPPQSPSELATGSFAYGLRVKQDPVILSPEAAAYIATASLNLTPPKPGIGPPPSINKWKMAAVGYPLWLWADGDTNPAPAADEVAGMTVSLDARVDKIVFQMGDGQAVTCKGTGTPWRRGAVTPGTPSPTCGYRYEKPSLPRGKYTVTTKTYWAVDWEINGETGTIPIIQQASVQLPVGELQVTVR